MVEMKVEYSGEVYDSRHGGPWDRGSADSWYDRPIRPHFFSDAKYFSDEIDERSMTKVKIEIDARFMTKEQIAEYMAGYNYNEEFGGKKE